MGILDIIAVPFGYLMRFLYTLFGNNYVLSIIFFTLIVRMLMIAFSIKQQKGQAMMAKMRPYEARIRAKYKDDPVKVKEEMDALYKQEGYSPYAGCLVSLVQLPIFLGLYQVIRFPMEYIARVSDPVINALREYYATTVEISEKALNAFNVDLFFANTPLGDWPETARSLLTAAQEKLLPLNIQIFGFDMTQQASFKELSWLWIFPIMSGVTALAMQLVTTRMNKQYSGGQPQPGGKGLMLFLPLFSVYIGFIVPTAMVFYWCVTNVIGALQAVILGKIYTVERVTRMAAKKKAKKGLTVTREEAQILIDNNDYKVEEIAPKSKKELKEEAKRRLAEARRREEEEDRKQQQ